MKATYFALLVSFALPVSSALAHQDGCHSWHSCPSDTGSYECGDWGYTSGCGGYDYPKVPTYKLSAPKNPNVGTINISRSTSSRCTHDVDISWEKPSTGDRYSIALSKKEGADPGNIPDTASTSFVFKDLEPGNWFINFKTGNAERWSSVAYWPVTVPDIKPEVIASIANDGTSQTLNYSLGCLSRVDAPQFVQEHLSKSATFHSGSIPLNSDQPLEFEIVGWDKNEKKYVQKLKYSPISIRLLKSEPSVEISGANLKTNSGSIPEEKNKYAVVPIALIAILYFVWSIRKNKD